MTRVKTAAAFEEFIGFCSGYGGKYNPGSPNLQLNALNELAVKVRQSLEAVNMSKIAWTFAINNRVIAFAGLNKRAASVTFALAASGASEQTMDDVRSIIRQITGRRKYRAPIASGEATSAPSEKARSSWSQRGYESLADHFARLIQLLRDEPSYQPMEEHLSINGLEKYLEHLRSQNKAVQDARVAYSNSRVELLRVYYSDPNSLVKTARAAKKYIRSLFGLNSAEYHQVIRFNFYQTQI